MTTTATIQSADVQADNSTQVVFEFTHAESGTVWLSQQYVMGPQGNGDPQTTAQIQAFGDSRAVIAEANKIQSEREEAWELGRKGVNIDALEWPFNGLPTIQKYFFRRLFNNQRDETLTLEKIIDCSTAAPYFNSKTNPQIRAIIDAGWTNNDVGTALNKQNAIGVQVPNLDHGLGELSLDDF